VKSVTTLCLALRREALKLRGTLSSRELLLRVHPEVARALQKEEKAVVEELERALAVAILIQGDPKLHHESFDILEV
jgi:Ribonuclease G/E